MCIRDRTSAFGGIIALNRTLDGAAASEALSYLDRCLDNGFRPGMGHVIPDRLFWAQPEPGEDDDTSPAIPGFEMPPHDTKH